MCQLSTFAWFLRSNDNKKVGDSGLVAEAAKTKKSVILEALTARVIHEAQQAIG